MQTLRAPGMTLNTIMHAWFRHVRPYEANNTIQTTDARSRSRVYTLTAEAKLIQITIIPYTRRLTGIQQGVLLGPLSLVTSVPIASTPNPHLCASSLVFSCASSD